MPRTPRTESAASEPLGSVTARAPKKCSRCSGLQPPLGHDIRRCPLPASPQEIAKQLKRKADKAAGVPPGAGKAAGKKVPKDRANVIAGVILTAAEVDAAMANINLPPALPGKSKLDLKIF